MLEAVQLLTFEGHSNRIVGQGSSSAAPHAAHSLPRVLQVQGSDQGGMAQMHRQLMFKGVRVTTCA